MLSSIEANDYLDELMAEAIRANGALADPSIDAFIKALLDEKDAGVLIWELVSDIRMTAIRRRFGNVLYRIQKEDGAFGSGAGTASSAYPYPSGDGKSGQAAHATHPLGAASPSPETSPSKPQTSARMKPEAALSAAAKKASPASANMKPKATMPAAPPPPREPPRGRQPTFATISSAARAYYDRFFINGKATGDLTVEEACGAKVRERHLAKWLELLLAQILASQVAPTSKRRIREFITPEEGDKYFHMAQEEDAA